MLKQRTNKQGPEEINFSDRMKHPLNVYLAKYETSVLCTIKWPSWILVNLVFASIPFDVVVRMPWDLVTVMSIQRFGLRYRRLCNATVTQAKRRIYLYVQYSV